jgi:hypothetical protein
VVKHAARQIGRSAAGSPPMAAGSAQDSCHTVPKIGWNSLWIDSRNAF